MTIKQQKKLRRHRKIRAKVSGTLSRPRLSVFRSSHHIYAQLIDDQNGKTLFSADSQKVKEAKGKVSAAREVGKEIAKKALDGGIKEAVFDRGGYLFHGRVKALADSARENGLKI